MSLGFYVLTCLFGFDAFYSLQCLSKAFILTYILTHIHAYLIPDRKCTYAGAAGTLPEDQLQRGLYRVYARQSPPIVRRVGASVSIRS